MGTSSTSHSSADTATASPAKDVEADVDEHSGGPAATSRAAERRLVRKLDARLLPLLILLYLWSFLDRINMSNAITLGLRESLQLQGNQVNTALAVFYVPYILFEIPSNYILKKIGPRIWLPVCVCLFGIIVICHGFVRNFSGLIAARFFLGLVEAGVLPGCSYLLTMWYTPKEVLQRYALFFSAVTLAGAFGSLLASGIAEMDGLRGYAGWQWIFIIEGVATVLIGLLAALGLPNLPEQSAWLSAGERALVRRRLAGQAAHEHVALPQALRIYFSDYKSYLAGFLYLGCNVVGYSVSYFLPTILQGFHYTSIQTQLHAVPPFAAAFAWTVGLALLASHLPPLARLGCALVSFLLAFAGLGILLNVHTHLAAQYAATFLVVMGVFGGLPIVLVYYFMQLERAAQRALGTAYMIAFGNIGGIVATFTFQARDAPNHYHAGYSVMVFGMALGAACTLGLGAAFALEGRRRG